MNQQDDLVLNLNQNNANNMNSGGMGRPRRSGSLRKSLLVMNTPPSMKKYEQTMSGNFNVSPASNTIKHNVLSHDTDSLQQYHPNSLVTHQEQLFVPNEQNVTAELSQKQQEEGNLDGDSALHENQTFDNNFTTTRKISDPQYNESHIEESDVENSKSQYIQEPVKDDSPVPNVNVEKRTTNNDNSDREIPQFPVFQKRNITPNNNSEQVDTEQLSVKKSVVRRSSIKRTSFLSTPPKHISTSETNGSKNHRKTRSVSIPSPLLNQTGIPELAANSFINHDFKDNTEKRSQSFVEKSRTPSPTRPTSDEIFALLASKESEILETKNHIEEFKKQLKAKEAELNNQYKELEKLKQNLSMELIKSHNDEQDMQSNHSSPQLKASELARKSNRLSFTSIGPANYDNDEKGSNNAAAVANDSHVDNTPRNPTQSLNSRRKGNNFISYLSNNSSLEEVDSRVGRQVFSSKSMNSQTTEIPALIQDQPIARNTILEEQDNNNNDNEDNIMSNSQNVMRNKPAVAQNKAKRASRMSMYFSKGMNLINQFDQILQSELEKKLGLEEEEEEEKVVERPSSPQKSEHNDKLIEEEHNTTVLHSESTDPPNSSEPQKTGYKYFFA